MPQDRIFCRTAAGDKALSATGPALPSDYRRILRILEGDTHPDVIRGLLRQYPDALLADWLAELQELGLVASVPADYGDDVELADPSQKEPPSAPEMSPDDTLRLDKQARAARIALEEVGAFLAPDRLKNRPRLAKKVRQITVLIVEDDPDQAALAKMRVGAAGYVMRIAGDFKSLVADLRAHALPDVLLLDVMLPDANGFGVLTSIRRHPKLALLPVIMLTALAKPDEVRLGLDLGADGYITKPYSKKIVTQTIRSVLKHS